MRETRSQPAAITVMPRASAAAIKWAALLIAALGFAALLTFSLSVLPMIALWRFGLDSAEFWSTSLATTSMVFLGVVNSRKCRIAWEKWKVAERQAREQLHDGMLAAMSHIRRAPPLAKSTNGTALPPHSP